MIGKCRCCCFMWLSGFFGLAAFVHVLRLVFRPDVQIGGFVPSLSLSAVILVVAGGLSLVFAKLGCGRCSCGK